MISLYSIIVAEAAAIGCDTMECFKVSGIQAVAEEEGVELIRFTHFSPP